MNEIKSIVLILILPALLLSCNQGMYGDYNTDNFNIPPFGSSEAAQRKAELQREYSAICKDLNASCNTSDEVIDCENMMALVETPTCTKKVGDKVSSADACSCNDVCNPDKIGTVEVNGLSSALEALKEEDVGHTFAYAGLKAIASRVEFTASPQTSNSKNAKIEALKIIDSMKSGEFLGKINSFPDISSFVKFSLGNPVLKERFLSNLKNQIPPKVSSEPFDPTNLRVGDMLSSGSSKYIVESHKSSKCLKKMGESSCEGNIVGIVEKLKNPTRSSLAYDSATRLKLITACINKTNCNGTNNSLTPKKEKLSVEFEIAPGFHPSIKEKLPDAIDCMKIVPKMPQFASKVKEIYGDKAVEILDKINKTKNVMKLKPFYSRPSTLATTNMDGLIEINNVNTNRTKDGLSGTLFHEWIHNLGYKHRENPKPDVAYTLGDLVTEMVQKGYCNTSSAN